MSPHLEAAQKSSPLMPERFVSRVLQHLSFAGKGWKRHWVDHRHHILMLSLVNVMITFVNELVIRTVGNWIFDPNQSVSFFVHTSSGALTIHSQALINIWMTGLTSLLAGPVYFLSTKKKRFWFFVGFAIFVSCLSQGFASLSTQRALFSFRRIAFDIGYAATIKFFMFEAFRMNILRAERRFFRTGTWRITQDILTTSCRVAILSLIRLGG